MFLLPLVLFIRVIKMFWRRQLFHWSGIDCYFCHLFLKKHRVYPCGIASQDLVVDGDFHKQPFTFDNPDLYWKCNLSSLSLSISLSLWVNLGKIFLGSLAVHLSTVLIWALFIYLFIYFVVYKILCKPSALTTSISIKLSLVSHMVIFAHVNI